VASAEMALPPSGEVGVFGVGSALAYSDH
jgi:hypothetical protein